MEPADRDFGKDRLGLSPAGTAVVLCRCRLTSFNIADPELPKRMLRQLRGGFNPISGQSEVCCCSV